MRCCGTGPDLGGHIGIKFEGVVVGDVSSDGDDDDRVADDAGRYVGVDIVNADSDTLL